LGARISHLSAAGIAHFRLLAAGSGYCIIYKHCSYYHHTSYAHNDEHAGKAGIASRAYHMPLEVAWRRELIRDA